MKMKESNILRVIKNIEKKEKTFFWKVPNIVKKPEDAISLRKSRPRSIDRTTGEILMNLVLSSKPKKILELGCSAGYSTLWISIATKQIKSHIYTIEIFKEKIKTAKKNFKRAGVEKMITLIEGDILKTLAIWKLGYIDFVFIDAEKKQYLDYYKLVFPLLKKGGIIVTDNIISHSSEIKPFLSHIKKDRRIIYSILNVGSGIMILHKK